MGMHMHTLLQQWHYNWKEITLILLVHAPMGTLEAIELEIVSEEKIKTTKKEYFSLPERGNY